MKVLHQTTGLGCPSPGDLSGILAAPCFNRAASRSLKDKEKKNQPPRDESTSSPRDFVLDMGTTSLYLYNNDISDIEPLVNNNGLGWGDIVEIQDNPIDCVEQAENISMLFWQGVDLTSDCQ